MPISKESLSIVMPEAFKTDVKNLSVATSTPTAGLIRDFIRWSLAVEKLAADDGTNSLAPLSFRLLLQEFPPLSQKIIEGDRLTTPSDSISHTKTTKGTNRYTSYALECSPVLRREFKKIAFKNHTTVEGAVSELLVQGMMIYKYSVL